MVAKEDRFAAGIDLMREMVGDEAADRAVANRQAGLTEVTDELLDWAIETSFGFLMQRPGLSMRDKTIAMLGMDIATLKSDRALREHARLALLNGVTPNELYEICFLLVWYCGMPSVREALDLVAEAIKDFQSAQEQQS